jgi:acyl-coenzyme A synthetase/AMP-(fatty) acid ligase
LSALIPCPVHEHARQRPQADAIRWPGSGRAIAWQLLSHYVSSTVRHFKEFGLHSKSRVIIIADLNPSLVIVVLSLWRMGVSVCVLGGSVFDPELVKAIEVLRPALMVVDRKRRIKAQQLLLEEAVALEEVKNFWYGSEDPSLMVDPRAEAVVFLENGKLVSAALEDLLGDRSDPGGLFLRKIVQSLRSGQAVEI